MLTKKQSYLLSLSILAVVVLCCLVTLFALNVVTGPMASFINERHQAASTFPFGGAKLGSMDDSEVGDIIGFVRELRQLSIVFAVLMTIALARLIWVWRSKSAQI